MRLINKKKDKFYLYSLVDYKYTGKKYPSAIIDLSEKKYTIESESYSFEKYNVLIIYPWATADWGSRLYEVSLETERFTSETIRLGLGIVNTDNELLFSKIVNQSYSCLKLYNEDKISYSNYEKHKSEILDSIKDDREQILHNAVHIFDHIDKDEIFNIIKDIFSDHPFYILDISETIPQIFRSNWLYFIFEISSEKESLKHLPFISGGYQISINESDRYLKIQLRPERWSSAIRSHNIEINNSMFTYSNEDRVLKEKYKVSVPVNSIEKIIKKTQGDDLGVHILLLEGSVHIDFSDIFDNFFYELNKQCDWFARKIRIHILYSTKRMIEIDEVEYRNEDEKRKYQYIHYDQSDVTQDFHTKCLKFYGTEDSCSISDRNLSICLFRNETSNHGLPIKQDISISNEILQYSASDKSSYSGLSKIGTIDPRDLKNIIIYKGGKFKGISLITQKGALYIETYYLYPSRWLAHTLRLFIYRVYNVAITFEEKNYSRDAAPENIFIPA